MGERTGYLHGTPSWVDIMSPDIAATTAFYSALFGWDLGPDMGPEAGGYRTFLKEGRAVAAAAPQAPAMLESGLPCVWITYITVESADEAALRVQTAGGTVIAQPFDVFDAGRMAVLADTEGAVFNVWQAGTSFGAELVNEPGSLCWNELASRTPEAASHFYGEVFGWHTQVYEEPMVYRELQLVAGQPGIAGMVTINEEWGDIPAHWMVYFAIENCDSTIIRAESLGGQIIVPATDIPPGRFSVIADPQGAVFSVLEMSELGE